MDPNRLLMVLGNFPATTDRNSTITWLTSKGRGWTGIVIITPEFPILSHKAIILITLTAWEHSWTMTCTLVLRCLPLPRILLSSSAGVAAAVSFPGSIRLDPDLSMHWLHLVWMIVIHSVCNCSWRPLETSAHEEYCNLIAYRQKVSRSNCSSATLFALVVGMFLTVKVLWVQSNSLNSC